MTNPAFEHQHLFTYGDYRKWPEEERWELIDGVAYSMTPAPSALHQRISRVVTRQIDSFLIGKGCEMFYAPFDVCLPEGNEADDEVKTVIQPDVLVVCDPSKLNDRGCRGAPDFIIEIISPSTARKDQTTKTALYEKHGVREYWIIHPGDGLLTMRILDENGLYPAPRVVEFKGTAAVATLPGLEIDLDAIAELCAEGAARERRDEPPVRERRI